MDKIRKNSEFDAEEITSKILEGMKLAFERLIEEKKKENSFLVFSENGKVVKVYAKDIKIT
jgi:hypothetical protein